jgi:Zn finger protein HypA/HybF involved in hydrogenase expression
MNATSQEKVVKCKNCDLYFGYSEKQTKCPFCHANYGKVEEGTKIKSQVKTEMRKATKKPKKESFKMWRSE